MSSPTESREMTTPASATGDHHMMPNNYQTVQDDAPVMSDMIELDTDAVIVDSVHLAPAGFPESGVPARPWNSGAAVAATSTAEGPVAQGEPDADMPAA